MRFILFVAIFLFMPCVTQAQSLNTAQQQRQLQSNQALKEISAYLNQLKSMKARFQQGTLNDIQQSNSQRLMSGQFYLSRPNKFRLEYDQQQLLSLSDGRQYIFYDGRLKETTYLPIAQLPFAFLLQANIDLQNMQGFNAFAEETAGYYNLYVTSTSEDGLEVPPMTFVFNKSPVSLDSWYYMGNDGQSIYIKFNDKQENVTLDKSLFQFVDPKMIPNVRGNQPR